MCFTSTASFGAAGLLISGGAFCVQRALRTDHKYLAMAFMPLIVGIQQFTEGMVWIGVETGNAHLLSSAALSYMLFVWMFWPAWVPFMVAMLEPDQARKRLLSVFAGAGLAFGMLLYLPYLWHTDWLHVHVVRHSLVYDTTLLTDMLVPRFVTCLFYLLFIGAPPLLSSHRALRLFGWSLIVFVPVTYFVFVYAYISILCFFAALATVNLVFIIAGNRCRGAVGAL